MILEQPWITRKGAAKQWYRNTVKFASCAKGAKGRKPWNPSGPYLGKIGQRSLQDIAGMEVSNVFDSFFHTFTTKN